MSSLGHQILLTIAPVTFLGASPPHLADAGLFSILEGRSFRILESWEGRQSVLLAQPTNWSNGGRKQYGDFAAKRSIPNRSSKPTVDSPTLASRGGSKTAERFWSLMTSTGAASHSEWAEPHQQEPTPAVRPPRCRIAVRPASRSLDATPRTKAPKVPRVYRTREPSVRFAGARPGPVARTLPSRPTASNSPSQGSKVRGNQILQRIVPRKM